jgi:hypothetical protein
MERMNKAVTYEDKLLVYARVYDQFTKSTFIKGGCPILNTATEADDTNVLLKDRAAKALHKWKKTIQGIISDGITAGEFKPETDLQQMAWSIIALIEGGIMIARVTNSQNSLDKIINTIEMLVRQIKR